MRLWSRASGIGRRAVALVMLPALAAGGLALADAIAGNLVQGGRVPSPRQGEGEGEGGHPPRGGEGIVPGAGTSGRQWAEEIAGGRHVDPVPPPPGAARLFRMAGGYTFYRLAEGDPDQRLAEAAQHYRRALAEGGWLTVFDGETSPTPAASAAEGRRGRLIVAAEDVETGGRTIDIFLQRRGQGACAIVRTAGDEPSSVRN